MCKAFSCIVPREGQVIWKLGVDSHEALLATTPLKDDTADPDRLTFARVEVVPKNNNYLRPDKWILRIDQKITPTWWNPDYEKRALSAHKQWLRELRKILVCKPIVHPFNDVKPPRRITKQHLAWLKEWESAWTSVWDIVWTSVREIVQDSVWASVQDSVRDSMRVSVWTSVQDRVRESVRVRVWARVGDSVWASVCAYIGSFFRLPRRNWKYTEKIPGDGYPFQPAVNLWEAGLVPSFDGKTWRLHAGKKARVIWSGKVERKKRR